MWLKSIGPAIETHGRRRRNVPRPPIEIGLGGAGEEAEAGAAMRGTAHMRAVLSVVVLLGLLAAAGGVAVWLWSEIGAVAIGRHGWIALGLGALLTFGLGAGLMALMFLSSRHGYDERAHLADRTGSEPARRPSDDT
jgi:hypothetical protein